MKIPETLTEEFVLEYYNAASELHAKALTASEEINYYYNIGDTKVRLQFAGNTLVPLLCPALAHLEIAPVTNPDFTVKIWESKTTGVKMLPPPCSHKDFTHRGDIYGAPTDTILMAYHSPEAAFNLFHKEKKEAIHWVQNPEKFHYWVTSSPLRSIFGWWMEQNNGQLLHAAAVGTKNGAVLISGRGGLGKSSTAVKGLNAGMLYLADDYLIIRNNPEARVYSLYSTAKIHRQELDLYPKLKPALAPFINAGQEKGVYFLQKHFQKQIVPSLPLRAILTPRVAQGRSESQLETVEGYEVLQAMTFTTTTQIPHTGEYTQKFLQNLVNTFPAGKIKLGQDPQRLTELLTSICNKPQETFQKIGKTKVAPEWPLISVIIPTYNRAHFIEEAVNNVLSQNYPALELIIVDDGSTDTTEEVVKGLNVDVHYLKQGNKGPAAARNRGIKNASGNFIAFLDSDDLWPELGLRTLMQTLLKTPRVDVARGYAQLFKKDSEQKKIFIGNPKDSFLNYLGAGLYRKEVFSQVGLFDEDLRFGEDDDWYLRAAEVKLSVKRIDETSLFVQQHDHNMTHNKEGQVTARLKLFKKKLSRHKTGEGSKELLFRPNYEQPNYDKYPITFMVFIQEWDAFGEKDLRSLLSSYYENSHIIWIGTEKDLEKIAPKANDTFFTSTGSYQKDVNRAAQVAKTDFLYFPSPLSPLKIAGLKKLVSTLLHRTEIGFTLGTAQCEKNAKLEAFLDPALALFKKAFFLNNGGLEEKNKSLTWVEFFYRLQRNRAIFTFVKSGVSSNYQPPTFDFKNRQKNISSAALPKKKQLEAIAKLSHGQLLQFLKTGKV